METKTKKPLTKRQQKFVKEYTKPDTKSATQAALAAGYSPKSAAESASENLKNSYIFEQIEMRKRRAERLAKVTPEQVLGATAAIAFSSIEDALDKNGYFDFTRAQETGAVEMIKKINRNPTKYGEAVSVEFYSKSEALAKLGNYIGVEKFAPAVQTEELERFVTITRTVAEKNGLTVEETLRLAVKNERISSELAQEVERILLNA